jgi:hypothetical protein
VLFNENFPEIWTDSFAFEVYRLSAVDSEFSDRLLGQYMALKKIYHTIQLNNLAANLNNWREYV